MFRYVSVKKLLIVLAAVVSYEEVEGELEEVFPQKFDPLCEAGADGFPGPDGT